MLLHQVAAKNTASDLWNVVIETPKGSRNKYKYNEQNGLWRLSEVLPLGASFPFDFGFIPSTRGEDGDPLVVVLIDEPTFPGCLVPARLIGVLEAEQTQVGKTVRNDRFVAVIETPYNSLSFRTLEEMSRQSLTEIEHFFVTYNQMEGRQFRPLGRQGPEKAQEVVKTALHRPAAVRKGASKSQRQTKK